MTDLAERLRRMANGEARSGIGKVRWALFRDAADEIERLQAAWDASIAERDELRNALKEKASDG